MTTAIVSQDEVDEVGEQEIPPVIFAPITRRVGKFTRPLAADDPDCIRSARENKA